MKIIKRYYKQIFIGLLTTGFVLSCSPIDSDGGGSSSGTRRCAATTQAGTQCKRDADKGSIYCWQHKK